MNTLDRDTKTTGIKAMIHEQLIAQAATLTVGSASSHWLRMRYGAKRLDVPPRGTSRHPVTHEIVKSDGTLVIMDIWEAKPLVAKKWQSDIYKGRRQMGSKPPRNFRVFEAAKAVPSLLRRYVKLGLYLVDPNDAEETKRRYNQARRVAARTEQDNDEKTIMGYWRAADKFQADPGNAGRRLAMTEAQREAMDRQDKRDAGRDGLAGSDEAERIFCRGDNGKCGYSGFDMERITAHENARHKELKPREDSDDAPEAPRAPRVPKNKGVEAQA